MDRDQHERLADIVESRRQDVFMLHFAHGLSISECAKQLGCRRATIEGDVAAIRATEVNNYRDTDVLGTLSVDAAVLRHVRELALTDYHAATDSLAKNEFLKTAVLATDTRWHLLAAIFDLIDQECVEGVSQELRAVDDEPESEEHTPPPPSTNEARP